MRRNLKIVCVTETLGLTVGKEYSVIRIEPNPDHKWKNGGYVIINDDNVEKWHEECPMGIIEILPLTGECVKYVGSSSSSLTNGKTYKLLDKHSNEYYYIMDDENRFAGVSKRNYFGGKFNFVSISKERIKNNQ